MTDKIRIGIVGYGNLGRGVQLSISQNSDMELVGIFTRRDPKSIDTKDSSILVQDMSALDDFKDKIDVLILCGGSKNDLPQQGPLLSKKFNTVDSFDTHARIPEYFEQVDASALAAGTTSLISAGWDPGLFSLNRMLGEAMLPEGETYTFWGKGLSQGHSDAVRRVAGVKSAVQYTIPSEQSMQSVRDGKLPNLSTREKHVRECYVVLESGADATKVEQDIVTMPDYFADYDTTVHFIDQQTLDTEHSDMPHGGFVIRSGTSAEKANQVIEFSLKLQSNPHFTASVLVAYARAVCRMSKMGLKGAKTVYDVAPGWLSIRTAHELRKELL